MMPFYADLHLHSKYSRATSRDCDLEHLALWARRKGLAVLGTGDFTHPAWRTELEQKLVPAEPGLFRLRSELERAVEDELAGLAGAPTRFMLQVEISTIYKKGDRTRKVHHLLYAPDFETVDRLVASLERIGNLASDGRPILGLDSRHLLEITLESGPGAYLVPAHIWTPWFSALGSRSGFDSVADCYADLAPHIFAVETGLSSDPEMNWRVSALDRYTLVSNSDAHSPSKLGREACLFETELDYFAMRRALQSGDGFGGTVEFFPEEGKYHLDGHRKCGVRLTPEQTRDNEGRCPSCGKPVTVGVMHRVEALADRPVGHRPAGAAPFRCLLPLCEVLGQLQNVGPGSKRVGRAYAELLERVGPELHILEQAAPEQLRKEGSTLLAEAIERMRRGDVICEGGFDGEYGAIRLFRPNEIPRHGATGLLFSSPADAEVSEVEVRGPARVDTLSPETVGTLPADAAPPRATVDPAQLDLAAELLDDDDLATLDPEQREAAAVAEEPLLIVAGPGTGKTRTLTHRIAHMVRRHGLAAERALAITFTRHAADELRQRLVRLLPNSGERVLVMTFHGLGWSLLREFGTRLGLARKLEVADAEVQQTLIAQALHVDGRAAADCARAISRLKRVGQQPSPSDPCAGVFETYEAALRKQGLVDFDDLVRLPVELLQRDAEVAQQVRGRFDAISVDEYQDIDAQQYRLLRLLAPCGRTPNLCVIGDPDQAIYGFRGADVSFFLRFDEDYPGARSVRLGRNYRSDRPILEAALQVIDRSELVRERALSALRDSERSVTLHQAASEAAEAEYLVQSIETLIGGHSFFSIDSGRSGGHASSELGFSDFAILYRTEAQSEAIAQALRRSGIPFQRRSHRRLLEQQLLGWIARRLSRAGGGNVRDQLTALLADSDHEDDDLAQLNELGPWLLALAEQCGDDRAGFIAQLALEAEIDCYDPRADRVSLLTLHASKGLEFPVVFIAGCEEGLLPLCFDEQPLFPEARDEERRLLFVGMTRAKDRLVLTHARKRRLKGRVRERARSSFIDDIADLLLEVRRSNRRRRKTPEVDERQLDLFGIWTRS